MRMLTVRNTLNFFIFSCLVMLTACSGGNIKMHHGDAPAKDQLAYLDSNGKLKTFMSKSAAVIVKKVNAKATNMEHGAVNPRIELLPGRHQLDIRIIKAINEDINQNYGSTFKEYSYDKTISFVAEPGHYYQLYAVLDEEKTFPWFAWIEDKNGGRVVAGKKPE